MFCSRKFRALIGAFLVAMLAFAPFINVAPTAFAEGDVETETQDVEALEANDTESEAQAEESVTYGGEQLSDWTYTENGDNSITLTAYNATATDIIIPGDFGDGKTVKINSFDMLKDKGITSLKVEAVDGTKVLYDNTSMANAFDGNQTVTRIVLNGLDTSKVTTMYRLFRDCTNLTEVDLSILDTSSCDSFASMFEETNIERIDLSNLDTTSLTATTYMFFNCDNLKSVILGSDSNIWKLTNMAWMFYGCTSLENLDLSHFDTRECVNMNKAFRNLNLQYLDLSSFTVKDNAQLDTMFDLESNANELPTAIISADPKLKALEQDGKLGNGRIPHQATITFNEDEVSALANDDNSNIKTIKADKIFYDSVAEFQEAQKAFTLTKDQVLAGIAGPTKAGFTFNGWFTDAAATTPLGDTLTLAGTGDNITLYAGWTAIEPAPSPEIGDVDNPGSGVSPDEVESAEQATDEDSLSTATPVTGDNVAVVAATALSMLILGLSTVVFVRKRRQQ